MAYEVKSYTLAADLNKYKTFREKRIMTASANIFRKKVCCLKDNSYFCGIILKDFI